MEHEVHQATKESEQARREKSLAAFRDLLAGDPAARAAVLGHAVPPEPKVETDAKPPERTVNQPKAEATPTGGYTEISLQAPDIGWQERRSNHDDEPLPPLAPPPVTAWMRQNEVSGTSGHSAHSPATEKMTSSPEYPPATEQSERSYGKLEIERLASTIMIDGISLKDIYESKQIDEEGLRAVVETYLRGGDIKKQLNMEIIEKQKSFERDPFTRKNNHKHSHNTGNLRQTVSQASKKIVAQSVVVANTTRKKAVKAGKSLASSTLKAQETLSEGSDTRRWTGIAAVIVIYTIILILLLG